MLAITALLSSGSYQSLCSVEYFLSNCIYKYMFWKHLVAFEFFIKRVIYKYNCVAWFTFFLGKCQLMYPAHHRNTAQDLAAPRAGGSSPFLWTVNQFPHFALRKGQHRKKKPSMPLRIDKNLSETCSAAKAACLLFFMSQFAILEKNGKHQKRVAPPTCISLPS